MELALADHIRALRKERRMTQEQFAEVMGVTTGAVYKWESGLSVPELELIVEMADFFDTSVDALLGYEMRSNRIDDYMERVGEYCRSKDPRAMTEAEKALKKYPNSFAVVHACAEVYLVFGTEAGSRDRLVRARELLERSRQLIAQNDDPEVSDLTICGELALAYGLSGEEEKAVELLKKNNVGGLFNDSIGFSLAFHLGRPEEAETYLSKAILDGAVTLFTAVMGQALVFLSRNDTASAMEIMQWGMGILEGLRKENTPDFLSKVYILFLVLLGHTLDRAGQTEEARTSLAKAWELAERFDAAPDYGLGTVRFAAVPENESFHDLFGATAAESAEKIIAHLSDRELTGMWREIRDHG